MRIDSSFTIESCERALDVLSGEASTDLVLPTNVRHAEIGGEAAISQVISTWSQSSHPARLRIYAKSADDPQIEKITRRLYGLFGVLCCEQVLSQAAELDLSKVASTAALERLQVLQGPHPRQGSRGQTVEVLAVDHLGLGAPVTFYRGSGSEATLRDEREFRAVVSERIIRPILPQALQGSFSSEEIGDLGSIVYELIKNTDEHGRTNINGDKLKRSVRGLFVRNHMITAEALDARLEGLEALAEYSRKIDPPRDRASKLQFLELSIIDTGPGFASRQSGKSLSDLSLKDEFKAVSECFQKNFTSKRETRFGQGLPYIVSLLRKHRGFLRLRTGRLSLYYVPTASHEGQEPIRLIDASGSSEPILRSTTNGSLVTIIIPYGQQ